MLKYRFHIYEGSVKIQINGNNGNYCKLIIIQTIIYLFIELFIQLIIYKLVTATVCFLSISDTRNNLRLILENFSNLLESRGLDLT